jgi:hypothetical protein
MNSFQSRWVLIIAVVVVPSAIASDMPKRASGLWEVKTTVDTGQGRTPSASKMCVDQSTDDLIRAMAPQGSCTRNELRRDGDRILTETVCDVMGSKATSRGEFTGDFTHAYSGRIVVIYEPPMFGMKQATTVQSATWMGPCPAGMKPGDVTLPDGRTVNLNAIK